MSFILSKTVLKGVPSSLVLAATSLLSRKPQVGKVIVRSVFDRTLFVLGRAVAVAAPTGLVLWLLANISISDVSILDHITGFLDPVGRVLGLDGIILTAFILGLPANRDSPAHNHYGLHIQLRTDRIRHSLLSSHSAG